MPLPLILTSLVALTLSARLRSEEVWLTLLIVCVSSSPPAVLGGTSLASVIVGIELVSRSEGRLVGSSKNDIWSGAGGKGVAGGGPGLI